MKAIFIGALLFATQAAFAQNVTSGTNSNAEQAVNVNNQIGGSTPSNIHESIRTAPTIYAPSLVTGGIETCLGSVSGGGSFMGWGIVAGGTHEDTECNLRMDANVAWKMDRKDLAVAIVCQSDVFRKASALVPDDPCAALDTAADERRRVQTATAQPQYTDPIVRARLGLPTLANK